MRNTRIDGRHRLECSLFRPMENPNRLASEIMRCVSAKAEWVLIDGIHLLVDD